MDMLQRKPLMIALGMLIILLAVGSLLTSSALAQSPSPLAPETVIQTSWVIANGSTQTSGGSFRLSATIGQPSVSISSGGGYTLIAGFGATTEVFGKTYLPLTIR